MSTAQTIIDRGYAKSSAARPNMQASPQELLDRIGQCLREEFQVFSRENINLLGTSAQASFNGTAWPRPSDCMRVVRVVADVGTLASPAITAGAEIVVVPFDDQEVSQGVPCLAEFGQAFRPTGQTMDPSGGTVTVLYARAPIQPVTVNDAIDPLHPPQFDDFLQYDLAAYLAIKDKRSEDEQTFLAMKGAILSQMVDWARQQTYSLTQRHPITTPPSANTNAGRQQPVQGAG